MSKTIVLHDGAKGRAGEGGSARSSISSTLFSRGFAEGWKAVLGPQAYRQREVDEVLARLYNRPPPRRRGRPATRRPVNAAKRLAAFLHARTERVTEAEHRANAVAAGLLFTHREWRGAFKKMPAHLKYGRGDGPTK